MTELSLDKINAVAPYAIESSSVHEGYYIFRTDYGIRYAIGFDDSDLLYSDESYLFSIINVDNAKSPNDWKVRDTVQCVIEEFFLKNNHALLYICETGDSKQALRNRLFERWFSAYKRSGFYMFHSAVVCAEGVPNYVALITRIDNPKLKDILVEFATEIQGLRNKPAL